MAIPHADTPTFAALLKEAVDKPGFLSAAYSAFHNYSIGNQLAAASQLAARGMNISPIASFKAWGDKGRSIKKGSKALALCMPVPRKKTDEKGDEQTFTLFLWRRNWFVLEDTEGEDFQHEAKTPEWSAPLALACLDINEERFAMPNGNCQGYAYGRTIAINPVAILPHKTRFHELAHVVLGHTTERMEDTETTARDVREVEAEGTAYILTSILGLPGQAESRGYIQSWLNGADISEKSAQRIYRAADKILKAGAVVMPAEVEPTTHAEPAPVQVEPAEPVEPAPKRAKRVTKAKTPKAQGQCSAEPRKRGLTDAYMQGRIINQNPPTMFARADETPDKAIKRLMSGIKRAANAAEKRDYPVFKPGDTTAAYVETYYSANFKDGRIEAGKLFNLTGKLDRPAPVYAGAEVEVQELEMA